MSHFWTLQDGQDTIRVGIYGGAGFVSVSEAALRRNGMPLSLQQDFLTSIDKVWDEPVDLMLGNHPFHNDTYQKYARLCQGDKDAFLDPGGVAPLSQRAADPLPDVSCHDSRAGGSYVCKITDK